METISSFLSRLKGELRSSELAEKIKELFEKARISLDLDLADLDIKQFEVIANLILEELGPRKGKLICGKLVEMLGKCGSLIPKILEEKLFPNKVPIERRKSSFDEVIFRIDPERAVEEARRCLRCRKPRCVEACPLHFPIPAFLKCVADKKFDDACRIFLGLIPTAATCSRICVAYCEKACTLNQLMDKPVRIRDIKRMIADTTDLFKNIPKLPSNTGLRVAVIGSGPAGLAAAYHLRLLGHDVTVFEKSNRIGGMLIEAIPNFRLPSHVVEKEVELIKSLGVEFKLNTTIGKDLTIDDLLAQGYHTIFIAVGKSYSLTPQIPGLELKGVHMALDFLRRVKRGEPVEILGKTWVIGGGDVAIDAARTALRLGAREVKIMYRRSRDEMPANKEEVEAAIEEGVEIIFLAQPIELLGKDGKLRGMRCIKIRLGEPGLDGRKTPMLIPGSEFEVEADHVIFAIGERPSTEWIRAEDRIELTEEFMIRVNENLATLRPHVFAGGDVSRRMSNYVIATADGIKVARQIDRYLRGSSTL